MMQTNTTPVYINVELYYIKIDRGRQENLCWIAFYCAVVLNEVATQLGPHASYPPLFLPYSINTTAASNKTTLTLTSASPLMSRLGV